MTMWEIRAAVARRLMRMCLSVLNGRGDALVGISVEVCNKRSRSFTVHLSSLDMKVMTQRIMADAPGLLAEPFDMKQMKKDIRAKRFGAFEYHG